MGVLWNDAICENAKVTSFTLNLIPQGFGTPAIWRIVGTAVFVGYDTYGNVLGTVQSSTAGKIPYFTVVDGLTDEPSYDEISQYFFKAKDSFDAWIKSQITLLSGK